MWLLIWIALAPNGTLTSGSIEFPTPEACEAGRKSWGSMILETSDKERVYPAINGRCVQKTTGKP